MLCVLYMTLAVQPVGKWKNIDTHYHPYKMLDNKHNGTFSCLIEGHALYSDGIIWTAVRYGAWKGSNSF